jgi:hypothetical protein
MIDAASTRPIAMMNAIRSRSPIHAGIHEGGSFGGESFGDDILLCL